METEYYPCINISFMHFFSENYEAGKEYAEKAWQICEKLKASGKHDYWIQATEAEALLLLGSVDDAVFSYSEALAMPDVKPNNPPSNPNRGANWRGEKWRVVR